MLHGLRTRFGSQLFRMASRNVRYRVSGVTSSCDSTRRPLADVAAAATTTIYVTLMDENVDVTRPAQAEHIDPGSRAARGTGRQTRRQPVRAVVPPSDSASLGTGGDPGVVHRTIHVNGVRRTGTVPGRSWQE